MDPGPRRGPHATKRRTLRRCKVLGKNGPVRSLSARRTRIVNKELDRFYGVTPPNGDEISSGRVQFRTPEGGHPAMRRNSAAKRQADPKPPGAPWQVSAGGNPLQSSSSSARLVSLHGRNNGDEHAAALCVTRTQARARVPQVDGDGMGGGFERSDDIGRWRRERIRV